MANVAAAITAIAGSAWLVQFRTRTQDQPFEKYVADAASAIHDEAFVLSRMAAMEAWTEPAAEAAKLAEQLMRLHRCLKFFQKGSPYTQIRNYGARMRIELLEEAVSQQVGSLGREIEMLGAHPTRGVVQVAKDKFKRATKAILENTEEVCAELGFETTPPSDDEVRGAHSGVAHPDTAALRRHPRLPRRDSFPQPRMDEPRCLPVVGERSVLVTLIAGHPAAARPRSTSLGVLRLARRVPGWCPKKSSAPRGSKGALLGLPPDYGRARGTSAQAGHDENGPAQGVIPTPSTSLRSVSRAPYQGATRAA